MTGDSSAIDDRELLRAYVREGSEPAFRELVGRHVSAVFWAAMRRVNGERALAEDVMQQVFMSLARRARGLPESLVLSGWLHHRTGRVALQALDRERRRPHASEDADPPIVTAPTAMHLTDPLWHQVAPVLDEALDRLAVADRDVLVLRIFAQADERSTALALGIPEATVAARFAKALEKLREALGRRGVTTTTGALSSVLTEEAVRAAPAALADSVAGAALALAASGGGVDTWWDLVPRPTRWLMAAGVLGVAAVVGWQQAEMIRWRSAAMASLRRADPTAAPAPPAPPRGRELAVARSASPAHEEVIAEAARIVRAGAPNVHSTTQALHGLLDGVRSNDQRATLLHTATMLEDENARRQIRLAVVEQWVQHDPSAAAGFVERAEPAAERAWFIDALGRAWLQRDPPQAAEWWMAQESGPQTLIKIMDVWAPADPDAAGAWLARHPPGPQSDPARLTFARQVAEIDPESALEWADTIDDASLRESTIDHVFSGWRARDAAAAEAFAQSSSWPQERRDRLQLAAPPASPAGE